MQTLLALAALALVGAPQPAPLDLMDQGCGWLNSAGVEGAKPSQIVAIGYVRGYMDAAVAACDQVNGKAPFCLRLRQGRLNPDVFNPSAIAASVSAYCTRYPTRTIGDATHQFMRGAGLQDPAPAGKR